MEPSKPANLSDHSPAHIVRRGALAIPFFRLFIGGDAVDDEIGERGDEGQAEPEHAIAWIDDPVKSVWRELNEGQRPSLERIRSAFSDADADGMSVGAALLRTRVR